MYNFHYQIFNYQKSVLIHFRISDSGFPIDSVNTSDTQKKVNTSDIQKNNVIKNIKDSRNSVTGSYNGLMSLC